MKSKWVPTLVIVSVMFAWQSRAGALEFFRDHLGISATNLVFGVPPSAFAGLRRSYQTANTEQWVLNTPESAAAVFSAGHRLVQFTFVSNRLEAVQVQNGGKATNDQLLAAFRRLLKQPVNPATGLADYSFQDGPYRLSYRGLCSPGENLVAIFRLTTEEGERRIQAATAAQAGGPAVFVVPKAYSLMAGEKPVAGHVMLQRNSGPAASLSVHPEAGLKVEVRHSTGTVGFDHYNLLFKPDGKSPFMPATWRFSVLFDDVAGNRQERVFAVVPAGEAKTPPALEVREVRE